MALIGNIVELGELIVAISLFIVILSGILLLSDPNHIKILTTSKEISYISSQISGNENVEILLNLKDENLKIDKIGENKISAKIKSVEAESNYIGKELNIEQRDTRLLIQS